MKSKLILCLALILSADFAKAASVSIHVLPNSPPDWNLPVSVRVTVEDFGKHFVVFCKADKTNEDDFLHAQLEVSSEDNQIVSCALEKKWTTNGVQFEFTVSASNLLASKFTISELAHIGKQPMPAFTAYWFYLRDFATNNVPVDGQTGGWGVSPEIIKALPKRILALQAGMTADEAWKELGLTAYKNRLGGESYPDHERLWLNWNYEIEFIYEKMSHWSFADEGNRKLIQAILYKNGLEMCRSGK